MLKNLSLERPLAILDLETTGTDPKVARIVEISVLKIFPDGRTDHRTRRINPGVAIPAEATAVHGITDADVANEPSFAQLAAGLLAFLDGCDLCGFNIKRFDLKLLAVEFNRVGLSFSIPGRAVIDPMEIFHVRERRDLAAAVRWYCRREHEGAHGAKADVMATMDILDAMLDRYHDLPRTIAELHESFRPPNAVDLEGRFMRQADQVIFAFGKYRGRPLEEVAREFPDYLEWMLNEDFLDDTKALVQQALECASEVPLRDASLVSSP
jgi:DNA polymerase-3 subunit epsilon